MLQISKYCIFPKNLNFFVRRVNIVPQAAPSTPPVTINKPIAITETTYEKQRRRVQIIEKNFEPAAHYGGRHTVTCVKGNGIGPEMIKCVKDIFAISGAPVDFEDIDIDKDKQDNEDLSYAIMSIKRNGVCLKGNIEIKSDVDSVLSRNVTIRNDLDLFIMMAHIISYKGVPAKHNNLDIVLMHQNTEGEYCHMEHQPVPGVVESMRVTTKLNCERVMQFAFNYARQTHRKKIAVLHNIHYFPIIDGIFLNSAFMIGEEYPDVYLEPISINRICSNLILNPGKFDIIIMPNLYGPLVLNTLLGLAGGPGLYGSINIGDHYAVFEPAARNIGNSIAGKNLGNPCAMINSAVDMLEHLGHT